MGSDPSAYGGDSGGPVYRERSQGGADAYGSTTYRKHEHDIFWGSHYHNCWVTIDEIEDHTYRTVVTE